MTDVLNGKKIVVATAQKAEKRKVSDSLALLFIERFVQFTIYSYLCVLREDSLCGIELKQLLTNESLRNYR